MTARNSKIKHTRPGARVRKDTALDAPVTFRVAEDELEAIRDAATEQGVSVSQWVRGSALAALKVSKIVTA